MGKTVNKIQRAMGRGIKKYTMIEEDDRILVTVSGGKDSLTLLNLLLEWSRYIEPSITLIAAHIDLGFEGSGNLSQELARWFAELGVEHNIISTSIARQSLAPNASKNPCFICSHHRRHAIYSLAHELDCSKIASGHHKDDIVETLLLNILFSRKIETLSPKQEVFQGKMHLIRPLALVSEELICDYAETTGLPRFPKPCPVDGTTRRDKVKQIIDTLQTEEANNNIRKNIFKALSRVNIRSY